MKRRRRLRHPERLLGHFQLLCWCERLDALVHDVCVGVRARHELVTR